MNHTCDYYGSDCLVCDPPVSPVYVQAETPRPMPASLCPSCLDIYCFGCFGELDQA